MALWLIRAGKYGQHEQRFFNDSRCYLTWDGTEDIGLSTVKDFEGVKALLATLYPDEKPKTRINWASQIAPFVFEVKKGDWVVLPRKHTSALAFAEVLEGYSFNPTAESTYRHSVKVKWLNINVPRTAFGQDLLYSFGAFMTVCRMSKNDAEAKVRAMERAGWKSMSDGAVLVPRNKSPLEEYAEPGDERFDVEQSARDQITKVLQARFKGHGMAQLVGAILRAQGFKTHVSPPGPDGGIDILAAPGTFGFAEPRICVQVKSQQSPVERAVLDALGGVMKKVSATHGLLVCWGGFKSGVDREEAQQFFHVRLWDADDLIDELLAVYDKLDADIRALLPLKRVWTLAAPEDV
ncbi:restriction endonuclease [Variovorax gossypii]|uniref:Restriction endonuclease n=1 Tax=Variovorax gossypii TaxID=1679495 RepID=A0A3S0HEB7_9BURK|nr:restriction endonuclease [Variovorax gossypii]RTQ34345.1 restriction endonuclease [Variovorax gossypii]